MYEKVKSGKEILDEFFNNLKKISDVDEKIAELLIQLYNDNKLTQTNISNALLELREDALNDKNQ